MFPFVLAAIVLLVAPRSAHAIPPPDFLFSVGAQAGQMASLLAILFSALAAFLGNLIRPFLPKGSARIGIVCGAIVLVVGGSVFAWRMFSERQRTVSEEIAADLQAEIKQNDPFSEAAQEAPQDTSAQYGSDAAFIRAYYALLGERNVRAAYARWSKTVPFETYAGWYRDVTGVTVESITHVDRRVYAVRVSLAEQEQITKYAALLSLEGAGSNLHISHSESRPIAAESAAGGLPLSVSNTAFAAVADQAFVLDAREDEEYDLGHFSGSTHIRFADLIAGAWVSLPTDQEVYVLCWSGIRGEEVTSFLREKGVRAFALEGGASGWVADGGAWEGEIEFVKRYGDDRYLRTVPTAEVHERVAKGAVLLDARRGKLLPGATSLSVFYTPSRELEFQLSGVPAGVPVITVCDAFVNCFDAKILGIKLEKHGHEFIGRYAAPWEYATGN